MLPQIVTANRLHDGAVVYLDAAGTWTPNLAEARVARDRETAEHLLALASQPEQEVRVIGPYLMDVVEEGGRMEEGGWIRPASLRECIRATGPTARTDRTVAPESGTAGSERR